MAVILIFKARGAHQGLPPDRDVALPARRSSGRPQAYAQWASATVLRETYLTFALWTSAIAIAHVGHGAGVLFRSARDGYFSAWSRRRAGHRRSMEGSRSQDPAPTRDNVEEDRPRRHWKEPPMQQPHAPRFRSSPDRSRAERITRAPTGLIEVEFRTLRANADEPLRGTQDICAGSPRRRGPMSRQQLPRFLEKAAPVAWLGPEPRDLGHAVIAPVDQRLARDACRRVARARGALALRPGAFATTAGKSSGDIAQLSRPPKLAGPVGKNRFAPMACVRLWRERLGSRAVRPRVSFDEAAHKFSVSRTLSAGSMRRTARRSSESDTRCQPIADPELGQQDARPGRINLDLSCAGCGRRCAGNACRPDGTRPKPAS